MTLTNLSKFYPNLSKFDVKIENVKSDTFIMNLIS